MNGEVHNFQEGSVLRVKRNGWDCEYYVTDLFRNGRRVWQFSCVRPPVRLDFKWHKRGDWGLPCDDTSCCPAMPVPVEWRQYV